VTGQGELRTERLILRPIERGDLDAYVSMFADPEVVRFIGDGTVASREESAEWLEQAIHRNEAEGWDMRSVVLAQDGAVIGRCGIAVRDIEGCVEHEVGYLFARERWGRGYATEAGTAVRDHATGSRGLRRLIALIQHGNHASAAVATRLGMTYERDAPFHGVAVRLFSVEV
jgi:RimJ/RimL family protein N-acetyltransferase